MGEKSGISYDTIRNFVEKSLQHKKDMLTEDYAYAQGNYETDPQEVEEISKNLEYVGHFANLGIDDITETIISDITDKLNCTDNPDSPCDRNSDEFDASIHKLMQVLDEAIDSYVNVAMDNNTLE